MNHEPWDLIIPNKRARKKNAAVDIYSPCPSTARLGFPPYLRPVVVLVLLPCPNAVTIHPRRSHGQRTPVVHYLSDQPSNEPLSAHCGLSAGNMRLSDLGTGYFPAAISVLTGIQGTDTKLMKFALYAVDDTANARQWCTICQTNPLMSLYQPIAVSVLEICGSVTSVRVTSRFQYLYRLEYRART
jgi:hypothetical protein